MIKERKSYGIDSFVRSVNKSFETPNNLRMLEVYTNRSKCSKRLLESMSKLSETDNSVLPKGIYKNMDI